MDKSEILFRNNLTEMSMKAQNPSGIVIKLICAYRHLLMDMETITEITFSMEYHKIWLNINIEKCFHEMRFTIALWSLVTFSFIKFVGRSSRDIL